MPRKPSAVENTPSLFAGTPAPAAKPASRRWTPEQLEAIRTTGTGLLVSAAAGSGKTSVLSERCAYLVCDCHPRCNISQLLVVTFTEAAAAEMKHRIEGAIRKRAADGPDDPHLRRQLKLIEHANVSTLHGFCNRLLRAHFHRAGLDPDFGILDADEGTLLRAEVVKQLFLDQYESGDRVFQDFIDAYGGGYDQPLMDLVLHTHDLMTSLIDPAAWSAESIRRLEEGAALPLTKSAVGKEYLALIHGQLETLVQRCRAALRSISTDFPKYIDYVSELAATAELWAVTLRDHGYDALAAAVKSFEPGRMPTYSNSVAGKERAAAEVKSVQTMMKEGPLVECLRFSEGDWQESLRATIPHAKTFLSLVAEFETRYTEAKRELRRLDFADLERHTLNLLRDPAAAEHLSPSSTARSYHHQFSHVLVDEYQDINELQDAILSLVSTECLCTQSSLLSPQSSNLFCVGDVKQSIYRFRLADPHRFLSKLAAFTEASTTNAGRLIPLSQNFRSRGALLETINLLFARLMTAEGAEIEYDQTHHLKPGADYPVDRPGTFAGSPIELHLISEENMSDSGSTNDTDDADLERTEYEAHLIAQRILELKAGTQVTERVGDAFTPRPLKYSDCVVLLRSPKFKADQMAEVLRSHNIPVHSDKGAGFFQAQEVQDVLALLKILDNQQQDIPLATFLRSPLSSLPHADDALARVRLAAGNSVVFHEAVTSYAGRGEDELAARLRDILHQLSVWRRLSRERPVADLLWHVYDSTGYLAFCAGLEDGDQRVANLLHLHERAQQFGTFSRQGLYRFLRFLDSLQEQQETAAPSVSSATDDVVRIMSIHASKGLEFPVVFLPDLGKRHNLSDARRSILVDRQAHVGLQVMDETREVKYPSLAHRLVRQRISAQSLAEELRLLYVALTRAKEHLILIGTAAATAPEVWKQKWAGHVGTLPTESFLAASTFLDWVGPVAAMLPQSSAYRIDITSHTREEILKRTASMSAKQELTADQSRLAQLEPLSPPPMVTETADKVIARLGMKYAYAAFTKVPAAASISTLTKQGRPVPLRPTEDPEVTRTFTLPLPAPACAQLASEKRPAASATDRGTATHVFLQHLDFARPCDPTDLAAQLDWLMQRRTLSPDEEKLVELEAVEWLLTTELGSLLRTHAKALLRELPLYLAEPATMFEPSARSDEVADKLMLRGRLDLLIPTPQGLVLIDYKTDNVSADAVGNRVEIYRQQLALYRDALQRMTGKPLHATYLVFLTPRVLHRL